VACARAQWRRPRIYPLGLAGWRSSLRRGCRTPQTCPRGTVGKPRRNDVRRHTRLLRSLRSFAWRCQAAPRDTLAEPGVGRLVQAPAPRFICGQEIRSVSSRGEECNPRRRGPFFPRGAVGIADETAEVLPFTTSARTTQATLLRLHGASAKRSASCLKFA